MKYLYLFVSLLFISLSSSAQSNYKSGYVVDLKNDTLKGFIDYKEWEKNPKSFTFKSNLNQSQPQKFSIDNANAFAITGAEYFQKFIFTKSMGATDLNKLSVHIDTSRALDTSFLRIATTGKNVSLYGFTDDNKTRFYTVSHKDHQLKELDYYIYYRASDNNTFQTIYTFRSQLQDLADSYNIKSHKLDEKLKYANYQERDIKAIVELINGENSQDTKQSSVSGVRYFAGAGARFNKLETGGGATFFPNGTNVSITSPVLSGGIDIFKNKYTQKIIFRTEINLSTGHYTIPATVINGGGTTATLDFKQNTAQLAPQLIYNIYSTNNFKISIDAGVSLNFSSYSKNSYVMNFNNVSTIERENYADFEKFYFAFNTKVGFVIGNKIELYVSRAFSSPISQAVATPATISYYQAGLNYLF